MGPIDKTMISSRFPNCLVTRCSYATSSLVSRAKEHANIHLITFICIYGFHSDGKQRRETRLSVGAVHLFTSTGLCVCVCVGGGLLPLPPPGPHSCSRLFPCRMPIRCPFKNGCGLEFEIRRLCWESYPSCVLIWPLNISIRLFVCYCVYSFNRSLPNW